MAVKWLTYGIPIYITWFAAHMVIFMSLTFGSVFTGNEPNPLVMLFVILSHFLVIFIAIAFEIYMIIDVIRRKKLSSVEKILWAFLCFFFSVFGSAVYYYIHGKKGVEE